MTPKSDDAIVLTSEVHIGEKKDGGAVKTFSNAFSYKQFRHLLRFTDNS